MSQAGYRFAGLAVLLVAGMVCLCLPSGVHAGTAGAAGHLMASGHPSRFDETGHSIFCTFCRMARRIDGSSLRTSPCGNGRPGLNDDDDDDADGAPPDQALLNEEDSSSDDNGNDEIRSRPHEFACVNPSLPACSVASGRRPGETAFGLKFMRSGCGNRTRDGPRTADSVADPSENDSPETLSGTSSAFPDLFSARLPVFKLHATFLDLHAVNMTG